MQIVTGLANLAAVTQRVALPRLTDTKYMELSCMIHVIVVLAGSLYGWAWWDGLKRRPRCRQATPGSYAARRLIGGACTSPELWACGWH